MDTANSKKLPFPKMFYETIDFFYLVISKTAAFPVAWDKEKKEFVANDFYHFRYCLCVMGMTLTGVLFDCNCFPVIWRGEPEELDELGYGIALAFVLHSVWIICVALLMIPPRRIVVTINEVLNYSARINLTYRPSFNPEKSMMYRIISKFGRVLCCGVCLGSIIVKYHYFARPHDRIYPFALFPPAAFNTFTYLAFGLISLYFDMSCWCMIGFVIFLFLTYVSILLPLIYIELMPKKIKYSFSSRLRTIECLPLVYRSVEILHKNVNQVLEVAIIPLQASIGQNTLYCNFLLCTRWNQIDVATKVILVTWIGGLCGFWTCALDIGGRFNSQAKLLIQSWDRWGWSKRDMKMILKIRKSCRPLGIRAGPYYCIKKRSVILFLRGIFEGTFRAFCISSSEMTSDVLMVT